MTIIWASVGGTIGSNETPKSAAKSSFRIEHSSLRLMHHPGRRHSEGFQGGGYRGSSMIYGPDDKPIVPE
jgi:hypothetical protein